MFSARVLDMDAAAVETIAGVTREQVLGDLKRATSVVGLTETQALRLLRDRFAKRGATHHLHLPLQLVEPL